MEGCGNRGRVVGGVEKLFLGGMRVGKRGPPCQILSPSWAPKPGPGLLKTASARQWHRSEEPRGAGWGLLRERGQISSLLEHWRQRVLLDTIAPMLGGMGSVGLNPESSSDHGTSIPWVLELPTCCQACPASAERLFLLRCPSAKLTAQRQQAGPAGSELASSQNCMVSRGAGRGRGQWRSFSADLGLHIGGLQNGAG